jgi:hypothetical protein
MRKNKINRADVMAAQNTACPSCGYAIPASRLVGSFENSSDKALRSAPLCRTLERWLSVQAREISHSAPLKSKKKPAAVALGKLGGRVE